MMNKDEYGGALTKEEIQFIEQQTLRAPDEDLTFSRVFALQAIPNPNAASHQYFVAEDDEGAAELVTELEKAPNLAVSNNRVTYAINKIKLGSSLSLASIQASRSWGVPLDVEVVNRVKRKVDEKTNQLAYVGDSKFGVPGVVSATGVTTHTGTDWATAGLDLANEVISAINAIPRKYRNRPYTLVLADEEYKLLTKFFNSSAAVGDRSHMERIRAAMPTLQIVNEASLDAGTTLYNGTTIAAGTALLIPRDQSLVRMAIAKAPYPLTENKIVDEAVSVAVAARVGIVETPFPTSIVKITGL
jgi:uncharacterized linocin/CFP29 family protein